MSTGENVRYFRKMAGMTQDKLAQAAGVSRPHLSNIERGINNADSAWLKKVAAALGVNYVDLLGESDEERNLREQIEQYRESRKCGSVTEDEFKSLTDEEANIRIRGQISILIEKLPPSKLLVWLKMGELIAAEYEASLSLQKRHQETLDTVHSLQESHKGTESVVQSATNLVEVAKALQKSDRD